MHVCHPHEAQNTESITQDEARVGKVRQARMFADVINQVVPSATPQHLAADCIDLQGLSFKWLMHGGLAWHFLDTQAALHS